MGDMSAEYSGNGRTGTFSSSRNCVQILATWGCELSCWNMRWQRWMNGTTMCLNISSRYVCAFKLTSIKMQLCSMSVAYAFPYHNPTPPWGTLFTTLTSVNHSPTRCHTRGLRLWGWLDVLPNSLKWVWSLMLEKLTFNSCSQHTNCMIPQNVRRLWHCVMTKLHINGLLLSPAQVAPV